MNNVVMTNDELEFAIFCIENIAIHLNKNGSEVYKAFTEGSSLLYDYIISNYGVLHTQGKDYIIEDILNVAKELGVKI
ncbi:MAG: DUF3791 domain-containing protein [Treponema sp.]